MEHDILLCLSGIIIISIICVAIVSWKAFNKTEKGAARSFTMLFLRADVLRIVTVLLVVICSTFLALAGYITSNGIVGILSGVSGYVLGSLSITNIESRRKADKSSGELGEKE